MGLFARAADEAQARLRDTPSSRRAREAVPDGGSVLDVGCGGGAASLPLAPPAARLVGVDEDANMLAEFAARAEGRGLAHDEVPGRWPDVASRAPGADVVVCHHVAYNVPDLTPFMGALDAHARRRVVVEMTAQHPLVWMNPLWTALHGLRRPGGPAADDAIAVLHSLGHAPQVDRWEGPLRVAALGRDDLVAFVRRRLCLPSERDDDVRRALAEHPPPATRALVTLSWDATGPAVRP